MRILRTIVMGLICACAVAEAHGQSGGVVGESTTSTQAPLPRGPVRISSGVIAGLRLTKVDPVYPAEALKENLQGAVTLHAIIGKDGHVESLAVISGPSLLQSAALDAVRQWTYKPYLLNGDPTEVDTIIIVNFNLNP